MKKVIYFGAVILFLGIFLFAGWKLLQIGAEYRRGVKEYEDLAQYVEIPTETTKATKPAQVEATAPTEEIPLEAEEVWPVVDFVALQTINPDVVGWIYIEGTKVNYPIVQGANNDQYLYRLISGEYNSSGSIFLDSGASELFLSRNNSIYGHNMKNGSMFAAMMGYKDQEFFEEHPVALLLTPTKNYKVHLFSAYVTDAWADAWQISFDDASYEKWLDKLQRKSYFAADVVPTIADCVLTFSTCTYETDDARFVVHGILEEQVIE